MRSGDGSRRGATEHRVRGQAGGAQFDARVGEELAAQARLYGLSAAKAQERAKALAGQFELDDLLARPVKTLSGGQRRRMDIAKGLVHGPRLVFLDEPTAALDPRSRANVWQHIRTMHAELGTTVFLTTHYLDEADALCDRVLVIDSGRIVATGSPTELKARISGDLVTVGVDAVDLVKTADIAGKFADEVDTKPDTVSFRVPRGDLVMPELLRALDAHDISTTSLSVQRPTLDDVFLILTGRTLAEADHAA